MGRLRLVPKSPPLRFVEVPVTQSHEPALLDKDGEQLQVICGKFRLVIPNYFDSPALQRLLKLLESLA